ERHVIHWENPQRPPHVEVTKVMRLALRIKQDARNQETREHEEQINTASSQTNQSRMLDRTGRPLAAAAKAIEHDDHDRQTATRIERRNMPPRQFDRRMPRLHGHIKSWSEKRSPNHGRCPSYVSAEFTEESR